MTYAGSTSERAPLPETLATPPRGRVLILAPHPDDDVIGCGGTLKKHAAQGDPVHVVVAFDGRRGDPSERFDPAEYVERRRREARAAAAHLGLGDYEFWDNPEGHEPAPSQLLEGARAVAACIERFRPDLVYAPWVGEQHIDHHSLGRAVRLAVSLTGTRAEAWGYEVWTPLVPTRIIDITDVFEAKRAALLEHTSQTGEIAGMEHKALAITAQRAMYLAPEARHGEGFAPLGAPDPGDAQLLDHDARA